MPFQIGMAKDRTGAALECLRAAARLRTKIFVSIKKLFPQKLIRRILVRRGGGIGDLLMLTPALRGLRARYPHAEIVVATDYPEIFENNPAINLVWDLRRGGVIPGKFDLKYDPKYERSYPLREHITDIFCRELEVGASGKSLDLYFGLEDWEVFAHFASKLPPVYVVVQPWVGGWAPSKNWTYDGWCGLVKYVRDDLGIDVVQIGASGERLIPGAVDLRGATSLKAAALLIRSAILFAGSNSSGEQLARAVRTPAVILYGTTHPVGSSYDDHVALYGGMTLTPCYDRGECSHGAWADRVSLEIVCAAVKSALLKTGFKRGVS